MSDTVTVSTEDDSSSTTVETITNSTVFNSIISQDWDNLAIDDGTLTDEFSPYYARIFPRDNTEFDILEARIEDISYSPEVNSAPSPSISVDRFEELEGTDYLGGVADVFVGREPLFSGEIVEISTNQRDDNFYGMKLRTPGKKLDEETIDTGTDTSIISDFIAKTVDKYNDYDNEFIDLATTNDEVLNNVLTPDNRTRVFQSGTSTATYQSVGENASAIERIYIKANIPEGGEIGVSVEGASESYSEILTEMDDGTFGQWTSIEPDNLADGEYDITFSGTEDSILYDWISLTELTIQRDVEPEVGSVDLEGETVQSADEQISFEEESNIQPNEPITIENGEASFLQTCFWGWDSGHFSRTASPVETSEDPPMFLSDDDEFGSAVLPTSEGDYMDLFFSTDYDMPEHEVFVRFGYPGERFLIPSLLLGVEGEGSENTPMFAYGRLFDEGMHLRTERFSSDGIEEGDHTLNLTFDRIAEGDYASQHAFTELFSDEDTISVRTEDNEVGEIHVFDDNENLLGTADASDTWQNINADASAVNSFQWMYAEDIVDDQPFQMRSGPDGSGSGISTSLDTGRVAIYIDAMGVRDSRFDYNDDFVVDSNRNTDGPEFFPDGTNDSQFLFNEVFLGNAVSKAYVDIGNVNDSNGVSSIAVSFDGGENFESRGNTTYEEFETNFITSSILPRIGLGGFSPNGERNETPKFGYEGQSFGAYDLSVDTIGVGILHGKRITGNRLKVISELSDNSTIFHRWEGNSCKIFKQGSLKTDIDLRKETVDSTRNIEDVYSSCEVIGKDGVTSGIVEFDDSPDYINRHKEIRDPNIESELDAARRANSFLQKHSEIDFDGNIKTLPTRAPLGEMIDGSLFKHGKDTYIERVRYSKRRSDITTGRTKDFKQEILKLDRDSSSTNIRETREAN